MSTTEELSTFKPYLLRAHHEWMVDNGLTPHLLVDAEVPGVVVPTDYVENGSIVLNVAPRAVSGLAIDNDQITFAARFNGRSMPVQVPMDAVRGLVAREMGVGVSFAPEPGASATEGSARADEDGVDEGQEDRPRQPTLTLVK